MNWKPHSDDRIKDVPDMDEIGAVVIMNGYVAPPPRDPGAGGHGACPGGISGVGAVGATGRAAKGAGGVGRGGRVGLGARMSNIARARATRLLALMICSAGTGRAQTNVPVRELAKPDVISTDHFGFILNVRALANGRVFVNDGKSRQLLMLDDKLTNRTVVIDSIADGAQSYGRTATPIIPYMGDSTLFVDGATSTLLLYGPTGAFVRVVAPPKAADMKHIASSQTAVDANGNLIYVVVPMGRERLPIPGVQTVRDWVASDSSFVVRGSFEPRRVDTIGVVRTPAGFRMHVEMPGDVFAQTVTYNPLTTRDEWAVFSDGTVGLVRGHDYHLDILAANGARLIGPKLPFDFRRVTDDDKRALIDSSRAAHAKEFANVGTTPPGRDSILRRPPGTSLTPAFSKNARVTEEYVPLDSMADYWPPIRAGAVKADLDAHLWILPTTSAQSQRGELVYDVVNNRGEMLYRLRMPAGRSVAGFGHDGVVYLMSKDAEGWVLERTRVVMGGEPVEVPECAFCSSGVSTQTFENLLSGAATAAARRRK